MPWWKATSARAFIRLSLPRSRSLGGKDHRNLARRSRFPPCCSASQTQATWSGEKARGVCEEEEEDDDEEEEEDEEEGEEAAW